MPPAARPHKLQATLRSAYVRLSQSRGAKLALLEPHAIPRPVASGRSRPFRCSSSPNCKRFAGLQFGSICLARKSRQKEALRPRKLQATLRSAYVRLSQSRGAKLALLEPHAIPRPAAGGRPRPFRCSSSPNCKRFAGLQFGSYIVRCCARFLFNALFGRKFATFPIVFGSGECTTHSCGQTAIISFLLISGIPDGSCSCTGLCRGRCPHRPVGNHRIRRRFP